MCLTRTKRYILDHNLLAFRQNGIAMNFLDRVIDFLWFAMKKKKNVEWWMVNAVWRHMQEINSIQ